MNTQSGPTSQIDKPAVETKEPSWIALELANEAKAREARDAAEKELMTVVLRNLPASAQPNDIVSISFALQLASVLSGEKIEVPPKAIKIPGETLERIILVLSSTGKYYYRVTAEGCHCKGFFYNKTCSHFKAGFPELSRVGPATKQAIEDYTAYLHSDYAAWATKGSAPYDFAKFTESKRDLDSIQNRLHQLTEQKKFDSKEYKNLEKVESHLCEVLGY